MRAGHARARRRIWATVLLAIVALAQAPGLARAAGLGFMPPEIDPVGRNREAVLRYGLGRLLEISIEVNNAFSAQNRAAIGRAAARLAALPGVRGVSAPSGLLTLGIGSRGTVTSEPLLSGGGDDDAAERVRQRLNQRADAVGWFISRDGTHLRFLIDADESEALRARLQSALVSSGLVLMDGRVGISPLWPDPRREPTPFPPLLPLVLMAAALAIPGLTVTLRSRPTIPRGGLILIAVATSASLPALFAPVSAIRQAGVVMGMTVAVGLALFGILVRPFRPPVTVRSRVSIFVLVPSLALVVTATLLLPRLMLGTQLWRRTSVFFVSVRGDMNEPVVLREVRRLTEFLRAQTGVAHAWSVADLFLAVAPGDGRRSGLPDDADTVQAIWERARADAAVALQLAPDHQESLIAVRVDGVAGVDRVRIVESLRRYLATELHQSLVRVDITDPGNAPGLRSLGRGVLAGDTREAVLGICARAGRNLSDAQIRDVDRVSRQAALLPVTDPSRLGRDMADDLDTFARGARGQSAAATAWIAGWGPNTRKKVGAALAATPPDATQDELAQTLAANAWADPAWPTVKETAAELRPMLAATRWRLRGQLNVRDMLYAADLPTEGLLSDEVRGATLEGMGPIVGIPVPTGTPGAFALDVAPVGGAPLDHALSMAWLPDLRRALFIAAGMLALFLIVAGGLRALTWWAPGLALAAVSLAIACVAQVPLGVLSIAFIAGSLGGGTALAVAFAPGRRDP